MSCILTIAIPTLNSNKTLFELLSILDSQLLGTDHNLVEILISNNFPSNKELKEIIFNYKNLRNFLVYNHNDVTLDFDTHLKKMVDLSNGKYIKFISDDDLVDVNFVKNCIFLLSKFNADIVVNQINTFHDQADLENDLNSEKFDFDLVFPPMNINKINSFHGVYGQISSLTFKKSLLLNLKLEVKTNYIHSFWFLSLVETSNIYFINTPRILIRLGSPNFSRNLVEKLIVPVGGVTAIKRSNISNVSLKRIIVKNSQDYVFKLLKAVPHLNCSDRIRVFKMYKAEFTDRPSKIITFFWYFFIPKFIAEFLSKK